jgi:8-oxo-dGTP diphosphatase
MREDFDTLSSWIWRYHYVSKNAEYMTRSAMGGRSNAMEHKPKVGVGVMILKEDKVLLGKRKGSHGEGEYAFPGGHLEHMESFEECARRETKEECGIEIQNIRFQFLANVTKYAPKHYVHIGLVVDWKNGEPEVLEPEACESWNWYEMDNLPEPMFAMCTIAIDAYTTGKNYYDIPMVS